MRSTPDIKLYAFRHAESELNLTTDIVCGRSNETPLTERGVEQAKRLGVLLREQGIIPTVVYSSPAVRAIDTAHHTLEAMGLEIEPIIDDALQELDQGDWTGRIRTEVYDEEFYANLEKNGKDFKPPNGESTREVGRRMVEFLEYAYAYYQPPEPPEINFAFAHGVSIRSVPAYIYNWTQTEIYRAVTENTSGTLIVRQDGQWDVEYLGRNVEEGL